MSYYKKPKSDEEIKNMEILTQKEAREYIKEQLKIGDTYYFQCVYPDIKRKFYPILINYSRRKVAQLRIRKKDLDDYIILCKRKLDHN